MWTSATRAQHTRVSQRYQTDLTDAEWLLIAHILPAARATGRRREWPMREIVNVIFYVLRGGIGLAIAAEGFSALADGLPLVCPAARRDRVRADEPCVGHG